MSSEYNDFVERVQRSQLVDLAALNQTAKDVAVDTERTVELLASRLVDSGSLSRSDADQLLFDQANARVFAARYHVLEKVGEGGMGAVYSARDSRLDRQVALKVLPEHSLNDPEAVARFEREARALAKVSHPNVIHAHDVGEDNGRHFLVMEYVKGVTLAKLIEEKGKIAPPWAADLMYQAACGLQHAHGKGLIHRDVKPSNLLITASNQVKLLDLGLARFVQDQIGDPGLTLEGMGMGTPDYMSPEQFKNAHVADHRSDIYALGCTLFHALAGRVPFPGSSLSEKYRAHELQPVPSFAEVCPESPAGLSLAVLKMMAKRPEDRFQSADEVVAALSPYVASSSASLPELGNTATWQSGQLTLATASQHHSARRRTMILGLGATLVVAIAFILGGLLGGRDPAIDDARSGDLVAAKSNTTDPTTVVTIQDGHTVSKNGRGEYDTIKAALDVIKPGERILILDDATYSEEININDPVRHREIRLESKQRAVVELGNGSNFAIQVEGVSNVQIVGLAFSAAGVVREFFTPCVQIRGQAGGTVLRDLRIQTKKNAAGICVFNATATSSAEPIVITGCHISVGGNGVLLSGSPSQPVSGVVVHNNRISGSKGLHFEHYLENVQVSNNFVANCNFVGMEVQSLTQKSNNILVSNNTFFGAAVSIRINDALSPRCQFGEGQLAFRNNILIGAGFADFVMLTVNPNGGPPVAKDSRFLHDLWQFENNWRDMAGGVESTKAGRAPKDHQLAGKEFLSKTNGDEDFLRPRSPGQLVEAKGGADEFWLPNYAGAIAPKDSVEWHWRWTWDVLVNKTITVSQDQQDKARFSKIGEALRVIQPGMTISVLDDGVYEEPVRIDNPMRHRNIVLKGRMRATIRRPSSARRAIVIHGVPGVRIQGLRLDGKGGSAADPNYALIVVASECSGVVVENLQIECKGIAIGILLENARASQARPALIKDCVIHTEYDAIQMVGTVAGQGCRAIRIEHNRLSKGLRGVSIEGLVNSIVVAGNVVWNCSQAGVGFSDLATGSNGVLIANNTVFASAHCFRVWDDPPRDKYVENQLEVANNIFFAPAIADMAFMRGAARARSTVADGSTLIKLWNFHHNIRDPSAQSSDYKFPMGSSSIKFVSEFLISRDPASDDFVRPTRNSPVVKNAAKKAFLPSYIGAVPPQGVKRWNWSDTWSKLKASK